MLVQLQANTLLVALFVSRFTRPVFVSNFTDRQIISMLESGFFFFVGLAVLYISASLRRLFKFCFFFVLRKDKIKKNFPHSGEITSDFSTINLSYETS